MTTATETPTAPSPDASPVDTPLASFLYGTDAPAETATPEGTAEAPESTPTDPSPAGDEPAPATVTAEEPKKEEPPKGTEDADPVKKQLTEQTAANKRLGRELAELKAAQAETAKQNEILLAKLEGRYQEPAQPTPDQAAKQAAIKVRSELSRDVANEMFGEEVMKSRVYAKGSDIDQIFQAEMKDYDGDSPTFRAIHYHKQPALKAMRILQTRDFETQYGEDPTKWAEKVILEAKPKILEELKKQLSAAPVTGAQPRSVSDGRNSGGGPGEKKEKSLASMLFDKS